MYVCMCCSMCVCMCARRPTVALDCVPRGDPRHATAPPHCAECLSHAREGLGGRVAMQR